MTSMLKIKEDTNKQERIQELLKHVKKVHFIQDKCNTG